VTVSHETDEERNAGRFLSLNLLVAYYMVLLTVWTQWYLPACGVFAVFLLGVWFLKGVTLQLAVISRRASGILHFLGLLFVRGFLHYAYLISLIMFGIFLAEMTSYDTIVRPGLWELAFVTPAALGAVLPWSVFRRPQLIAALVLLGGLVSEAKTCGFGRKVAEPTELNYIAFFAFLSLSGRLVIASSRRYLAEGLTDGQPEVTPRRTSIQRALAKPGDVARLPRRTAPNVRPMVLDGVQITAGPAGLDLSASRCLVCRRPFDEPTVVCERCQAPHHRDCWEFGTTCATFGCGSVRAVPIATQPGE
jgi:hypothetical protein